MSSKGALGNWCLILNSEFTQQDGRKKRTAKRSCVANVTGLLLACYVVIFTYIKCFLVFYKKICLKEGELRRNFFSKKILSRLSHRVYRRLSSPVLLRKLTNVRGGPDVMQTNVVSIATLDAGTTPAAAP